MGDLEKMKEEFLKNKKMSDDELNETVGGAKTGDFDKNGEVYIAFPSMVSFLSGYYNTTKIEELAVNYAAYKSLIRMYITKDVKEAVKALYKRENKSIPSSVSDLLVI